MVGTKRKCGEKKAGGRTRRSRYVGVSWFERDQKWEAKIQVRGVRKYLGRFRDEASGARAYDAAVAAQNLRYPRNFPGDAGAEQAVKRRDNISAIPDKGKSRFLGVSWHKQHKQWRVETTNEGKRRFIGLYDDETAAAWAFDAYVISNKINRDLNFPSASGAAGHRTTKKGRSSRHRGVCWDKRRKKWRAEIRIDGKSKSLGSFVDEDDAGRAYDAYIRKHFPVERPHGWKRFNFPSADGEEGSADGGDDAGTVRAPTPPRAATHVADVALPPVAVEAVAEKHIKDGEDNDGWANFPSADGEEGSGDGGDDAGSARGGASSSSAAVAARVEEEDEEEEEEEEEPPRRRHRHRHRDTRTFAQIRKDDEPFYKFLRANFY
jgi:hypothetical protein